MAKQYKKLRDKIHPKQEKKDTRPRNIGKDYLLLIMIFFTVLIMLIAWDRFGFLNRALYIFLAVSLSITYANRHARMTEQTRYIVERAGWISMGIATILFLVLCYQQYIA